MHTTHNITNRRGTSALVLAGVSIVLGHALSVDIGNSGRRYVTAFASGRALHVAGGLITATAALLLSIGLRGVATSFAASGKRLPRAAAIVGSIGAAGLAMGLAMVALVMGALTGSDRQLAVRAYDVLNHATLSSLPFLLAYLFTIGVLALAVWLVVAGGRLRLIGALLLLGTLVDFVSPSGGVTTAALHIPQAIAFALLGLSLASASEQPGRSVGSVIPSIDVAPQPLPTS